MPDNVIDRREVGIPHPVVVARHETEQMRDEARGSAEAAAASAGRAASSEAAAQAHASDARQAATEAAEWATLHNQGIHFGPEEPETRWDGMTWIMTDEAARKIKSFRRWDAALAGKALWPSAATFPGPSVFPTDRGAWTDFSY